jgi:beta-glucosidase
LANKDEAHICPAGCGSLSLRESPSRYPGLDFDIISSMDPAGTNDFNDAVKSVGKGQDVATAARRLLSKLDEDEKLALLQGDAPFWKGLLDLYTNVYTKAPYVHGEIKRLGIPGLRYCDGPRGVNINRGTVFPCSPARGATWDPRLEEAVGRAIGLEARAHGANMVGSACINLPRHPAWGRVQETYGEDPVLLGAFGAAHVRGRSTTSWAVSSTTP